MNFSDHLSALIYLKNKVSRWKNIALLAIIAFVFLVIKVWFDVDSDVMGTEYIAEIKVEGVIVEDDHRSKVLKELATNNAVKAVIVRFNSPGGTIVGSEILYQELLKIKANKPIVALIESVGASGAYLAALASDYIIAYNGTLTGSIGVLMESPEIVELANKVGVKMNSFKSSPLKGSPSMFEKTSLQTESVIKDSIADSYSFFMELVKKSRSKRLDAKNYNIVFDGRVFTGRQALAMGLIDSVGGMEDVEKALIIYKINPKIVPIREVETVKKEYKLFDHFFNKLPFFHEFKNLANANKIMAIMP